MASRRIAFDAHQLADRPLLVPPNHQPSGCRVRRIGPIDAVNGEQASSAASNSTPQELAAEMSLR
jgi:hypothetical protein